MKSKKVIIENLLSGTQDETIKWAMMSSGYGNYTSVRGIKKVTSKKKLEFTLYINKSILDSYLSINFSTSVYSYEYVTSIRCREEDSLLELIELIKDKLLIK